MNTRTTTIVNIAIVHLLAVCAATNAQPSFMGLGDLLGSPIDSRADAVSADGSVVVGQGDRSVSGGEAFRWTMSGGMVGLGFLPPGTASWGYGVSASGAVVVGQATYGGSQTQAYRWTETTGIVGLGFLPGAPSNSFSSANNVSPDGTIIVGASTSIVPGETSTEEAFRWTESTGMVSLGDLPGGRTLGRADGVSADGTVIVGSSQSSNSTGTSGDLEAFRWTQATGMVAIGDLPGGGFNSFAGDVSADGSVVVGSGTSASGGEAFRWTQATGMVGLGDLSGGGFSSGAAAVSADGSVIVGTSESASGVEAFIWDQSNGMRSLRSVLVNDFNLGASLTGWTLTGARGISADGRTIVGLGINPNRQTEAWIARLVPEPSTLFLVGMATVGLLMRRRVGSRCRSRGARISAHLRSWN